MTSFEKYKTDQDFGFTAVDEASLPAALPEMESPTYSALEDIKTQLSDLSEYIKDFAEKYHKAVPCPEVDDADHRLREVEELIMPLLINLMKNPEKEYILWPNRQAQIQKQIDKILVLTRRGVNDGSN